MVKKQVAVIPMDEVERLWDKVVAFQSLKDQMGLSAQEIENTYALAYLMHQQKRYQEASDAFKTLMLLDLSDWRFPFGFAACQHALGHWSDAAMFFFIAAQLNPDDPYPCYYTGDCFQKLGRPDAARLSYQEVLERISKQRRPEDWKAMQGQTELILEQLGPSR
jgi:type III secretion system low calcium response chaperone LcrH/SycD